MDVFVMSAVAALVLTVMLCFIYARYDEDERVRLLCAIGFGLCGAIFVITATVCVVHLLGLA